MNCPASHELSRAMSEGADANVEAHLAACPACTEEWSATRDMIDLARQFTAPLPPASRREEVRTALLAAHRMQSLTDPSDGSPSRHRVDRRLVASVGAALALAAGFALYMKSRPSPTPGHHGTIVALTGAQYLEMSPSPDERVMLTEGSIDVQVSPLHAGERFRILLGDAEVEVHGTRFIATAEHGSLVGVVVDHGVVEVRPRTGAMRVLHAGEAWHPTLTASAATTRSVAEPPTVEPAPAAPALVPDSAGPVVAPTPAASVGSPAVAEPAVRAASVGSPAVAEPAVRAASVGSPAVAEPAVRAASVGSPAVAEPAVRAASVGSPAVAEPAVRAASVGSPAVAEPAVRAAPERPAPTSPTRIATDAKPADAKSADAESTAGKSTEATSATAEATPQEREYDNGWAAMRTGKFDEAATAFRRVLLLDPTGALAEDATYWSSVALARSKQSARAMAAFRDFLDHYPHATRAGEASAMLGWLLVSSGNRDEAVRRFKAAVDDRDDAVRTSARAGLDALSIK